MHFYLFSHSGISTHNLSMNNFPCETSSYLLFHSRSFTLSPFPTAVWLSIFARASPWWCTGVKQRKVNFRWHNTQKNTHALRNIYHVFKSTSKLACLRAFICCTDALRHKSLCQESTCRPIHCKPLRLSRCFCYAARAVLISRTVEVGQCFARVTGLGKTHLAAS